jgi:hypothetical protein
MCAPPISGLQNYPITQSCEGQIATRGHEGGQEQWRMRSQTYRQESVRIRCWPKNREGCGSTWVTTRVGQVQQRMRNKTYQRESVRIRCWLKSHEGWGATWGPRGLPGTTAHARGVGCHVRTTRVVRYNGACAIRPTDRNLSGSSVGRRAARGGVPRGDHEGGQVQWSMRNKTYRRGSVRIRCWPKSREGRGATWGPRGWPGTPERWPSSTRSSGSPSTRTWRTR